MACLPLLGLRFHKVKPNEIKPIGHPCHACLVAVDGQIHPLGDALKGSEYRLRTSAADQDGVIGVAV